MAFFAGDQLAEGERERAGDAGPWCFLGAVSGDPDADRDEDTRRGLGVEAFVFLGSGVLDTLLMGLLLGEGDCLLCGDADAPRRGGGGLEEGWEARGRGEGECLLFCGGERVSLLDLLGGDPFLCLEDMEGERRLAVGELLCFGGGEWETLRLDWGEGEALLLGGGGGEAVLLLGGGDGEYRLWIGGEYLRGEGERLRGGGDGDLRRGGLGERRRRGGGAGEGERRRRAGGGEGLLLLLRGEDSFWRLRGDGEGLRECECRRRLPTSPFFTFDLLGLSSSEEDEEPESDEDC